MARRATLRGFIPADSGVVAVEFAFIVPVILALFLGGYSVSQAVALSRKVTITTRALADLTTQYSTLSATNLTTIFNASTQIVAPFDPTPLSMRVTQVTTDITGLLPTVSWSKGSGSLPAYAPGSPFTLPLSMLKPSTSYVYSEIQYQYTPMTAFGGASFSINDHLFMLPRLSSSISYSG